MIARRVYWTILIVSILIGVYFYFLVPEKYSPEFLKNFSVVPFFLLIVGVHGIMAHSISAEAKHRMIAFPLVIGMIYVVLFFLHLFVVMPLICP